MISQSSKQLMEAIDIMSHQGQKAIKQFDRMLERKTTKAEVDVEFGYRNSSGSVYLVVAHLPGIDASGDVLVRTKAGVWEMTGCRYRFSPHFVKAYITSIYGRFDMATGLQIAHELACLLWMPKEIGGLGSSAMNFLAGGVEITRVELNIQRESTAFVPYEKFDRNTAKEVYAMVLRRYATGEAFDTGKIPPSFVESALALASPEVEEASKKDDVIELKRQIADLKRHVAEHGTLESRKRAQLEAEIVKELKTSPNKSYRKIANELGTSITKICNTAKNYGLSRINRN